jgi:hypothetical protein
MFKRRKTDAAVWINPHSNLSGGAHFAWDRRKTDAANVRYLELADVALRPKKSESPKANDSVVSDDPDQ